MLGDLLMATTQDRGCISKDKIIIIRSTEVTYVILNLFRIKYSSKDAKLHS